MSSDIDSQQRARKSSKALYKKWWFWGIIVLAVAAIVVIAISLGNNNKPSETKEYYDNEKVDVNGLTIKEACEKLRDKGWTVSEVTGIGGNGYSRVETSDCSDETHKVSRASYEDDKSYSNTPSVTIYFNSDKQEETSSDSEEDEITEVEESSATPDTSNSSSAPSSTNSSSAPAASSTPSSSWKEVLSDYEAWVDNYIAFMKKYNNANSSDMAAMVSDYTELSKQQLEWTEKVKNLRGELSGSDLTEYLNTLSRINQKLAELYN